MLNDILTLDQQWLFNKSDFPPISWPWYRLWPLPNFEWFPLSICNECGMLAGNAYPSGHLVPSAHFGTCLCSNCWDKVTGTCHVFTRLFTSNTLWYFLDFASNRCAVSFSLRVKTVWNPLRMNTERCWREEGHNSYPLDAVCLLEDFSGKNHENITRNSSIFMMSSSEYLFLEQSAPSQNMFLRALIPNICIYGYRFWKWRRFGWYW